MLQAILFDQDGVIIDTERHGHRVAFNMAFQKCQYPDVIWDEDMYHDLLQIGGGKERIQYYFQNIYKGEHQPENIEDFAKEVHKVKTELFVEMIPSLPLRPGIHRFMSEIQNKGAKIGICTTSNEKVAKVVSEQILSDISFDVVIAGDMVKKKKPDPEIYKLAMEILGVSPESTLVVEDSHIGVTAAKSAGCTVLATYNGYTKEEDLSAADFITNCLGDPDGEKSTIEKAAFQIAKGGVIKADYFDDILG